MASLNIIDLEGKEKEKINISDEVVKQGSNEEILYQEVRRFLATRRAGTHSTKGRSEVSGGGRKPWRQKGTGNARAGSNRSPLWRGGGIIFGPKPRDYSFKLNKKVIRKSKFIAISEKFKNKKIIVVEDMTFESPKTKKAQEILENLKVAEKKVLLVLENINNNTAKSFKNIESVLISSSNGLSAYNILVADYLMFTKNSLLEFIKGLGNERS
ncbi:MAG: 50S ribosomal protein L4 [Actinobacteria bacterium]|nr:50S ribosomal protein L4 [Actinomycetota bacterium]MBU4450482.1 50S ribosomal protein L4 [Actinomycetota bacterium]MCG2789514.1 50S ribosomal protein L4 [Actinomycetes bacterium]